MTQEIQFKELSRTKRKYGESVEYNNREIAKFVNATVRVHFHPHGEVLMELKGNFPPIKLGDWITKDEKGNIGVKIA